MVQTTINSGDGVHLHSIASQWNITKSHVGIQILIWTVFTRAHRHIYRFGFVALGCFRLQLMRIVGLL